MSDNYPDEGWVRDTCKIGQGHLTCRYLTLRAAGYSCEKNWLLRGHIDAKVAAQAMGARGDNCPGKDSRE